MRNSKKAMCLLIGLLAVGFAAVTTILVINGTSLFGTSEDDFVIIFTKAIVDGVENYSLISQDGKKITYKTNVLSKVGDESVLDFTVRNTSTQYDAEVSIECIGGDGEGTYYEVEKDVADYIPAQTEDVGSATVRMIKSSTEPIEEEFTCTITAEAVERDTNVDPIVPATDVIWWDSDGDGTKNIGDIITIKNDELSTEQFYILNADDENVQMMSMYNLYVGGEWDCVSWSEYENATGLQDSRMEGYGGSKTGCEHLGVTAFSSDEQRGENYSDYEGSIVEGYVNSYSGYLNNIMGVDNTATIISKEELESLLGTTLVEGYLDDQASNVPPFLYSTTYWTRSASDETNIFSVQADGRMRLFVYSNAAGRGVRPVVTIANDIINEPTVICNEEENICWEDMDVSGDKTLGDIITINETEDFYVIDVDDEISLLSKYGINTDTMLQADVVGSEIEVPFASSAYWSESEETLTYPYDLVETGEPSSEHYAAYYAYKYGESLGVTTGRLLYYEEARSLDDTMYDVIYGRFPNANFGSGNGWYYLEYWLGTASDSSLVSAVYPAYLTGLYVNTSVNSSMIVRPVITISADLV